jgi:4-diphosphocytidyl-2-C-methyl-D-erythritol kinase
VPFTLPSYAKINLYLRVLGRRIDGFHELVTVFQTVSLHDTLTFEKGSNLRLTCDDPNVPTDGSNLILQAAEKLRERSGTNRGATIHLDKRIPSQGGLGGGSSNAAVTLIGLSRLWSVEPRMDELHLIAQELGSDVPFFLNGGTALGLGRGDVIEPMPDIRCSEILIVSPQVSVSTAEAYSKLGAENLTSEEVNRILPVCRLEAESLDLSHSELKNDFEQSVFALHPEIARVKQTLLDLGAVQAAMSGSGASVFAIFDKTDTRQAAEKALDQKSTWRRFAVATISRDEYREALRC